MDEQHPHTSVTKVVCWNMGHKYQPWRELAEMDADVALLQETCKPPSDLPAHVETETGSLWTPWEREDYDRWPMVVKLSDRVEVEWFEQVGPDGEPSENEMTVSDVGLVAAARVIPKDPRQGEPFIAVSMYAHWNQEDHAVRSGISIATDMASLINRAVPNSGRILAAGDLNTHYRPGAYGDMETRMLVDTMADQFGYIYRIYQEEDGFTVVLNRPNGEAFNIFRKKWQTL